MGNTLQKLSHAIHNRPRFTLINLELRSDNSDYSQFAPLPIRLRNQLAPLSYRASWYPVLPAKLLAAIY